VLHSDWQALLDSRATAPGAGPWGKPLWRNMDQVQKALSSSFLGDKYWKDSWARCLHRWSYQTPHGSGWWCSPFGIHPQFVFCTWCFVLCSCCSEAFPIKNACRTSRTKHKAQSTKYLFFWRQHLTRVLPAHKVIGRGRIRTYIYHVLPSAFARSLIVNSESWIEKAWRFTIHDWRFTKRGRQNRLRRRVLSDQSH